MVGPDRPARTVSLLRWDEPSPSRTAAWPVGHTAQHGYRRLRRPEAEDQPWPRRTALGGSRQVGRRDDGRAGPLHEPLRSRRCKQPGDLDKQPPQRRRSKPCPGASDPALISVPPVRSNCWQADGALQTGFQRPARTGRAGQPLGDHLPELAWRWRISARDLPPTREKVLAMRAGVTDIESGDAPSRWQLIRRGGRDGVGRSGRAAGPPGVAAPSGRGRWEQGCDGG